MGKDGLEQIEYGMTVFKGRKKRDYIFRNLKKYTQLMDGT
jgi:hypothetical protein